MDPDSDGDISDCDQSHSDLYGNWHVTKKNSQLHPIKGCISGGQKMKHAERCHQEENNGRKFSEWRHYFQIQWNSLQKNPVKKISQLRSQDKKAPKFFHLINITGYPFNTSPHKKISRLRRNKFHDKTIFFIHLIPFLFQNLKEFPRVSIRSVSKTQCSNGVQSRSLPPRFTQQNDTTSRPSQRCCISSTMQRLQCVTPHYSVSCHDNRKIVSGGRKPIRAVSWPAWACAWEQPGTWWKLRQPITFEEAYGIWRCILQMFLKKQQDKPHLTNISSKSKHLEQNVNLWMKSQWQFS
jgi:hypothetical protein